MVCKDGFASLRDKIRDDPIAQLERLPFIDSITSWHLAKNLGIDVAKNDRHLARLAARFGYHDAHELCGDIAERTGEPAAVIDIVLWRHAALNLQTVR